MTKFVSEWNKGHSDFTFPEGMPMEMQQRVINRRRQVLTYAYIMFGLDIEVIGDRLWTRICRELEELQAAWGYEFGFYDYLFDDWSQDREDHLFTNKGIDSNIVNHALQTVAMKKQAERRAQEIMAQSL